jgi:hypothetical protein
MIGTPSEGMFPRVGFVATDLAFPKRAAVGMHNK